MTATAFCDERGKRLLPEIDRRAFPRHVCRRPARCRLSSRPFSPGARGRVVDISQGGAGLVLQTPFKSGDLVQVEIEMPSRSHGLTREAEVRWIAEEPDGGYRIGCCWIHRLTYAELRKLL